MKLYFAVLTFLAFAVDFGQLEKSEGHGPHHRPDDHWQTTVLVPSGSEVAQVYSSIESDITNKLIPKYEHITLEPVKEAVRGVHFKNKTILLTYYVLLVPVRLENNGTKHSICFEADITQGIFIGKPVYKLARLHENRGCRLNYPHNRTVPTRKPHPRPHPHIMRKQLNPRGEESRRVYEGVRNQMESQLTDATFYLPDLPSKVFSFTRTYQYPVRVSAFAYELIVMVKVAKSQEQRRFVGMVSRKVKHGDTVYKLDSFHETEESDVTSSAPEDNHVTPAPEEPHVMRKKMNPRGKHAVQVYNAVKKDIIKILPGPFARQIPKYPSEMYAFYRTTTKPIRIIPHRYDMVIQVYHGKEMIPTEFEASVSRKFGQDGKTVYKLTRFEKKNRFL